MNKKSILLTGASGVIGSAIARLLAQDGYELFLVSRAPQKIEPLVCELRASGVRIRTLFADLSLDNEVNTVITEFCKRAASPYALICNAGNLGTPGPYVDLNYQDWKQSLESNFFSHAQMIHVFSKYLVAHQLGGRIIVLSGAGLGGSKSFENVSSYSTAKAALTHLVEAVSSELLPRNITINAVAPGAVVSGMTEQAIQAGERLLGNFATEALQHVSSGGVSADLAARLISFLLSEEAVTVTGRLLAARFDTAWLQENGQSLAQDRDRFRLRRIDGELFQKVSHK